MTVIPIRVATINMRAKLKVTSIESGEFPYSEYFIV